MSAVPMERPIGKAKRAVWKPLLFRRRRCQIIPMHLRAQRTAVQISWAEQRRLLKTREKASPKGCSGDQVAALDKIEIMLLSQLGLHSRQ